jgi:hypothetical protein
MAMARRPALGPECISPGTFFMARRALIDHLDYMSKLNEK